MGSRTSITLLFLPTTTAGPRAVQISLSTVHTCARMSDGTVAVLRRLGASLRVRSSRTFRVSACAVLRDGTVACTGLNWRGQLGDGTTVDRRTFVRVNGVAGATQNVTGNEHACASSTTGPLVFELKVMVMNALPEGGGIFGRTTRRGSSTGASASSS